MPKDRVVVVGAGMGGLAAAITLAARGAQVTLCERACSPGGKMREVIVDGARIDAGPTVLTLKDVFESLFDEAGDTLSTHVSLQRCDVLARHAWGEAERFDLHADRQRSAEAIGELAGAAESHRYLRFCAEAEATWRALERAFVRQPAPSLAGLLARTGMAGMLAMGRASPFSTMWQSLGRHFQDPRLRQLFGRYATYCGSSPYDAPATLTLVAHVEQAGVWLVRGGMYRLAEAMAGLAGRCGVQLRYGTEVRTVDAKHGRIAGVTLASGERLPADAAVLNTDVAAAVDGHLGGDATHAVRLPKDAKRSLSAITWNVVAKTAGFPLHRHTVFFSRHYEPEFEALFTRSAVPEDPTVYVCAQDRGDAADPQPAGAERLLCLINAPATGDAGPLSAEGLAECEARAFAQLARCGLRVERQAGATQVTTPHDFERLFPATGGALYGMALHGWRAAFQRPGCRTRLPGLYVAGGSVHPGPGVPMAALSGKMAAEALLSDLASTRR